ncbi:MAG: hypothetical protein ACI4UE_02990 [Candidatus Scatovivens sp.]
MGKLINENWDIGIEKFKNLPEKLKMLYLGSIGEQGIKKFVDKYPKSMEYMPKGFKEWILNDSGKTKKIKEQTNTQEKKKLKSIKFKDLSLEEKEKYLLEKKKFPCKMTDDEIWDIVINTRNKEVFGICIKFINLYYLKNIVNNQETDRKTILKLTMYPDNFLTSDILKREDIDSGILYQMIKNFEDIDYYSFRDRIINHEKMDEETLYKLCECENNQILSQILLSEKVSDRIIKKLEESTDKEIKNMALVIDPQTDQYFINGIIDKELKKAIKVEDDYPIQDKRHKTILLTDTLFAALKNPKLNSEALLKYKFCTSNIVINYVIKHPNITNKMLEFYKQNGTEKVKEAAIKKIEERNSIDFSKY